jgi:hypothetical protein
VNRRGGDRCLRGGDGDLVQAKHYVTGGVKPGYRGFLVGIDD